MSREHECTVSVRYADTDQMKVVHHANFLAYMEEARTQLFASLNASYADFERSGLGMPVRRVEVRYRQPVRFGDTLRVRTRVTSLKRASIIFEYEIMREGDELCVEGLTELACVNLATMRPVRFPADFMALFDA